jgi:hypothetical protein
MDALDMKAVQKEPLYVEVDAIQKKIQTTSKNTELDNAGKL